MPKNPEIQSLIGTLSELGYQSFQIRDIIDENLEIQDIDSLTPEQADELIDVLQNHIEFAIKCRSSKIR